MHAILVTLGTDGDVLPYLRLGAALRERGHRVTVVAPQPYADRVATRGLKFRPLVSTNENEELLGNPDFWHPLKCAVVGAKWGARFLDRQYELISQLAREEDSVLVANPGAIAARVVHDRWGTPMASIVLQPWMIKSTIEPPVMPAGLTLPRGTPWPLSSLYWLALDAVAAMLVGGPLSRLRRSLGLGPVRRMFHWWLSPQLVIGFFPEWFGAPRPDWPPQVRLAGFPLEPTTDHATLPSEVEEFLAAGEPPIVFTFGTGMMHAADLFRVSLEACQILGARGLFITRYRPQIPDWLPPTVRHVEFAPFRQLFPRSAAVVHHGGVGTITEAMFAGVPQLVLPIAYDQFDNAIRVKRLGAGDWVKPRDRSGARVARALSNLIGPDARGRSAALRSSVATDAITTAARWIEELGGACVLPPSAFASSPPRQGAEQTHRGPRADRS